jgi:hypothetical protein
MENGGIGDNLISLWGPANQEFSTRFWHDITMGIRFITIHKSSKDRLHGEILFGYENFGCEMCEWVLSRQTIKS